MLSGLCAARHLEDPTMDQQNADSQHVWGREGKACVVALITNDGACFSPPEPSRSRTENLAASLMVIISLPETCIIVVTSSGSFVDFKVKHAPSVWLQL